MLLSSVVGVSVEVKGFRYLVRPLVLVFYYWPLTVPAGP